MLTGLFFGSFNPFHNGHAGIARHMLDAGHCEELWFVVSPCNPFKEGQDLLPERVRLEIVEAATRDDPRLLARDDEFSMPRPSYTARTLEHLVSRYPSRTFCLILGADNLLRFREWRDHEIILQHCPLLVYPRPGVLLPSLLPPRITVTEAPLLPFSSTDIRARLSRSEDISRHVPASALPLIKHYYSRHLAKDR